MVKKKGKVIFKDTPTILPSGFGIGLIDENTLHIDFIDYKVLTDSEDDEHICGSYVLTKKMYKDL